MTDSLIEPHKIQPVRDWDGCRRAFVERNERPTYQELAAEFKIPFQTIAKVSVDSGWPTLRAQFAESQLAKSDAAQEILATIKGETVLIRQFREVAQAFLSRLIIQLSFFDEPLPDGLDYQGRFDLECRKNTQIQSLSFVLTNTASSVKAVGLAGATLRSRLEDEAGKGNGGWAAGLLASINVNVNTGSQPAEVKTVEQTGKVA